MSVSAGYKATEVGVIPDDWEVENLGNLLSQNPSYGINAPAVAYDDRLPRYLRITDIAEDGTFSASSAVSVSHPLADRYYLEAGDVVFARTGASTGKSYRYRDTDGRLVYAGFLIRVTPDPKRLNSTYLAAHVRTRNFYKYVAEVSQRSGQPGINSKQLAEFEIAVPPTVIEQAAIAEALSDVDEAIAALEAVIAKKRALKSATMQALLSGTHRLPGFSGDWERTSIGRLGSTYGGLTGKVKSDFGFGNARYVTFMNVITNAVIDCTIFERVRVSATESQNRVRRGDLLFNGSSETPEEVALCSLMTAEELDLYLNSFCFGFRIFDDHRVDGLFLSYYLRGKPGRDLMKSLAQGSTRYNISKKSLLSASIALPSMEEQMGISKALMDLDDDLNASTATLTKLLSLKAGMMQQLLTGKIRLI